MNSSHSEPRQLKGIHSGVEVLVTLWPDGKATIASRLPWAGESWGPPDQLEETE